LFILASVAVIASLAWMMRPYVWESGPVELTAHHPFRSPEAQQRYLAHYDSRGSRWPGPSESLLVDTSFGATFVRVNGSEDAPPLVLLPGGNATSLIWAPNIAGLSQTFRTFAVDNVYDFGRSVYTRRLRSPEDFVAWLDELFDGLGIGDDAHLAGLSYGGWIAAEYGLARPNRLHGLILIAPAATVLDFDPGFLLRGATCLLPHPVFVRNLMYWVLEDAARDPEMRRVVNEMAMDNYHGIRCFEPKPMVSPRIFSDDELRALTVPTLFLVGENEKIYSAPASAAIERLRTVAPHINTELIPSAGHGLTLVQAERVNTSIVNFIDLGVTSIPKSPTRAPES
jgi:pimeloyl-ACP methyl ester carboxylesterase